MLEMAASVEGPESQFPPQACRSEALSLVAPRDVTWDVMSAHIKDVVILADLSGTVFYASPSCRTLGYEQADLIGRSAVDFFHPDDLEHANANLAALLAGADQGQSGDREHRIRRKDGTWVWMEGNPSLLPGGDGGVAGIVNIFRDVTERRADREAIDEQARRGAMAEAVAGVGYWRLDAATLQATWSPQMFRIYGLEVGDTIALGQAMAMVHPDEKAESEERIARSLRTGEGWTDALTRIIQRGGAIRYLNGRCVCEIDANSKVIAVFGTVLDVTAQVLATRTLEESERRYRLITDNATDMISITSCQTGRLSYLSPSVRRVTGFDADELIGARMQKLVHPDDLDAFMTAFGGLVVGGRESGEAIRFRARHKDGAWLWLESNPRLVRADDGTPIEIIDVTRDVSQQEQMKAQLQEALVAAEQAATVKSEFLANMSHEIRTPLTAVLGFAGLLADRRDLDGTAQHHIERIAGASRALLAVVNDVLDFSKLEAGEVTIRRRPASAERAGREVLEMFALAAQSKGVTLAFEAAAGLPQSLILDDDRLRQILINLVGNAVKFTEAGHVSLTLAYTAAGALVAEVTDTGPGISAEARARLFQRFSQVDGSSTRAKGGTGLGLAICLGLAEAMGGAVSVESRVGQGSTFRLVLPAASATFGLPGASLAPDATGLCGLRILVADDNAANRELTRAILEPAGVEVSEACNGEEAVAIARDLPFDVILMDLRMPRLDGRGALAAIRLDAGPNQHMPVVAFSAEGAMDAAECALQGFQGVVRKPTSRDALLTALIRVTDLAQEGEEGLLNVAR